VLLRRDSKPVEVLLSQLLSSNDDAPLAVFCEPVKFVDRADPPVAVLSLPVLLLHRVHLQYPVLYEPVVFQSKDE
jgi:hypothetical protein